MCLKIRIPILLNSCYCYCLNTFSALCFTKYFCFLFHCFCLVVKVIFINKTNYKSKSIIIHKHDRKKELMKNRLSGSRKNWTWSSIYESSIEAFDHSRIWKGKEAETNDKFECDDGRLFLGKIRQTNRTGKTFIQKASATERLSISNYPHIVYETPRTNFFGSDTDIKFLDSKCTLFIYQCVYLEIWKCR